jgi:Fe-S-cluster containining protein
MIEDEIELLNQELNACRQWDDQAVARNVADTGFRCKRCGKCCKGEWGDNTVSVFPGEVREIARAAGLDWLEIARPMESQDSDERGEYHTFEWALKKQKNGDCKFLQDGRCSIYASRPLICKTYPMRLDRQGLETYDCDGLGTGPIDAGEAKRMAAALHERQVREAGETISLLRRYEPFRPGTGAVAGDKVYVVHDSEGSRRVLARADGSLSFL